MNYINATDLEGVLSLFEDHALVVTGPGNTFAEGKKDIKAYFSNLLATEPKSDVVHQQEPIINDDIALTS